MQPAGTQAQERIMTETDNRTKYSRTRLKRPLKKKTKQRKVLKTIDSLMRVESIAECSLGAFCNTFDLL